MSVFANNHSRAASENDSSPRKLAFVLSGGGPRGALQVGALRALMEEGIVPDLLVGTSIGAVNSAYLARYGYSLETLDIIIKVWDCSARGSMAFGDFVQAMLRALLPGVNSYSYLEQARAFHAKHGITPDLRFGDLIGPELYIVAADISHHEITIFGENHDDLVLDSMLASVAIPPWIPPLDINGRLYLDGGAVSDVPIEPAMRMGATEMIVMDLFNPTSHSQKIQGVKPLVDSVITTMEARHLELEIALAESRGVPIHHWPLRYHIDIPLWDMSHTHDLIHVGYEAAKAYLAEMKQQAEAELQAAEDVSSPAKSLGERWEALLQRTRALFAEK